MRTFSGAKVVRVVDAANSQTDQHAHDWPILSLHVLGACRKLHEGGETRIAGPSVVLHGVDQFHANVVGPSGLEQIEIQFDPSWIGMRKRDLSSMRCWTGGAVAAASFSLAKVWRHNSADEAAIASATRRFLELALEHPDPPPPPAWLDRVLQYLDDEEHLSTQELALRLGVRPVRLLRAYRAAVGEGLHQTRRRKRVERAIVLLRDTSWPVAQVAIGAGFCDQSHMIRCFRATLGRTPLEAQGA